MARPLTHSLGKTLLLNGRVNMSKPLPSQGNKLNLDIYKMQIIQRKMEFLGHILDINDVLSNTFNYYYITVVQLILQYKCLISTTAQTLKQDYSINI